MADEGVKIEDLDPTVASILSYYLPAMLGGLTRKITPQQIIDQAGLVTGAALATATAAKADAVMLSLTPGGRLTLATALPIITSDTTSAGTIYYTPYRHNIIQLYNGTQWIPKIFTEMSQALTDTTKSPAAAAANKVYDYFVWDDAETLRCTRGPGWDAGTAGSNTARGTGAGSTELELFEGRWVNKVAITNGPAARRGRYVGTIRTNSGEATVNFRFGTPGATATPIELNAWNLFNQELFSGRTGIVGAGWSYTSATWRMVNADANMKCSLVRGQDDKDILAINSATGWPGQSGVGGGLNFGLDNTTPLARALGASFDTNVGPMKATLMIKPGIGAHDINALEATSGYPSTFYHTYVGNEPTTPNIHGGLAVQAWA